MQALIRRSLLVVAVLGVFMTAPALRGAPAAEAHPIGNFSVSRYARIVVGAEAVQLRYVIDMAEIPAFQEVAAIDTNGDKSVDEQESDAYRLGKAQELLERLELRVDGQRIEFQHPASRLTFPEGQGGLPTLRIEVDASAPAAVSPNSVAASFKDGNYSDRVGWKEIVVQAGAGIVLAGSSAASSDQSAELTAYPEERLKSPLDVREAAFRFEAGAAGDSPTTTELPPATRSVPAKAPDRFASLVSREQLTPAFVAVSLLAAVFWGAAHALGPGHGKTIVAAYLVGTRSTAKHALILGLTVTATHTSTVFALGLFTLYASRYLPAEDLYLWLSVASGALVLGMGCLLLTTRLRSALRGLADRGTVPHRHNGHSHSHAEPHAHAHESGHGHSHDHGHSHLPKKPGLRGLIALGISGGLLPCPTALVVMLAAIALDRVAYGLILVIAFSAGLAGVLTGLGVLLVVANRVVSRQERLNSIFDNPLARRLLQVAPVLSAAVILAVGALLTGRALSDVV
jgi:ABC-type nickel/cobalt efflux system permease component RcnA